MKTTVAVYDSHDSAFKAIRVLDRSNFSLSRVSLMSKAEIVDDDIKIRSLEPVKNAPAIVGAAAGPVVGLLSGMGVFAIPGFGFIYGAGALIGTIAGFGLGLAGGSILSLMARLGIKKEFTVKYKQHMEDGKCLLIVQGNEDEIDRAEKILQKRQELIG